MRGKVVKSIIDIETKSLNKADLLFVLTDNANLFNFVIICFSVCVLNLNWLYLVLIIIGFTFLYFKGDKTIAFYKTVIYIKYRFLGKQKIIGINEINQVIYINMGFRSAPKICIQWIEFGRKKSVKVPCRDRKKALNLLIQLSDLGIEVDLKPKSTALYVDFLKYKNK